MTPKLREMQVAFQKAILDGDDAVLDRLMDNSLTDRTTLFGVYRNAYVGRLTEVLRDEYPITAAAIGEDAFQAMARAFIAAHPSRTQNARWYGNKLPEFLKATDPHAPAISEVASLEKALSDAFDAADEPVLTYEAMAAVRPDDWPDLTFTPHPSAATLTQTTNAFDVWRAAKDGAPPPPAEALQTRRHFLVWRHEMTPKVRPLKEDEWMAWRELTAGSTFGELCALLAVSDDPETAPVRAVRYLKGWLNDQALSALDIARTADADPRTPINA